jgi:hypothetical protein
VSTVAGYGENAKPAKTLNTPPTIVIDTAYVDFIGLLTYSLSNSLDEIEKVIFTRTGKNINLINVILVINTNVLNSNVKALMNRHNVNYFMTAYGRHITVNKRENN